jgi:hypothetical protein
MIAVISYIHYIYTMHAVTMFVNAPPGTKRPAQHFTYVVYRYTNDHASIKRANPVMSHQCVVITVVAPRTMTALRGIYKRRNTTPMCGVYVLAVSMYGVGM